MLLRKLSRIPVLSMFVIALSAGALTLPGCDVDVEDRGPMEEVTEGEGLDVEVD